MCKAMNKGMNEQVNCFKLKRITEIHAHRGSSWSWETFPTIVPLS